jgi:hypothetical protein
MPDNEPSTNQATLPGITTPQTAPNEPRLYKKTRMALQMVAAGIEPREALQAVNIKNEISRYGLSKFNEKVRKYSLNSEPIARLASHQIKRILTARAREEAHTKVTSQGQVVEYTDNVYPTDSNILAAAQLVYDRYEPVKAADQGQAAGATYLDLSQITVNVSSMQGAEHKPQAIDITPNGDKDK